MLTYEDQKSEIFERISVLINETITNMSWPQALSESFSAARREMHNLHREARRLEHPESPIEYTLEDIEFPELNWLEQRLENVLEGKRVTNFDEAVCGVGHALALAKAKVRVLKAEAEYNPDDAHKAVQILDTAIRTIEAYAQGNHVNPLQAGPLSEGLKSVGKIVKKMDRGFALAQGEPPIPSSMTTEEHPRKVEWTPLEAMASALCWSGFSYDKNRSDTPESYWLALPERTRNSYRLEARERMLVEVGNGHAVALPPASVLKEGQFQALRNALGMKVDHRVYAILKSVSDVLSGKTPEPQDDLAPGPKPLSRPAPPPLRVINEAGKKPTRMEM